MVGTPRYQPGRPEDPIRGRRRWGWTELYRVLARYRRVASGTDWRGSRDGDLARWKMGDHETGQGRAAESGSDGNGRSQATDARCRNLQRSPFSAGWQTAAGFG